MAINSSKTIQHIQKQNTWRVIKFLMMWISNEARLMTMTSITFIMPKKNHIMNPHDIHAHNVLLQESKFKKKIDIENKNRYSEKKILDIFKKKIGFFKKLLILHATL